ncbi:uncharacterized protein LOC128235914 [Mya arenaria]|uniref:uncharacterized protein LOC128235914 n=1 Tax=Mya arenaria TaxID=6604 RepID=UPI0022E8E192|nr:uncharacterized protein LOC128235914 [Mya arenaria]
MAGGTIRCSTRCEHSRSHSDTDYEVSSQANPPSNLKMISSVRLPPITKVVVKCTVDDCNAKGQWKLRWEDGNRTETKMCNTAETCLLTQKYSGDREMTDICKSQDFLNISLTVTCSKTTDGSQSKESGIQTFSLTFPFSVNNVLIGTGVICGLCILFVIERCVYLKRQKISAVNITENVENHSVPSSDNGVLHITTEGVQYAVVQRQAATRRTETQQPHDDDSLTYAVLDINFLQEANARVSLRRYNMPTEYADIEFSSTQEPEKEDYTSTDNGVQHIATEDFQYAVVQRQAATRRTDMQQPLDDDSLTYAELDIKFLQEANTRVLARRKNTPTEYADIEFAST